MKKIVRRGFTLPEILVTVTVIAVLAAVVVPAVTQYVNKGDAPASSSDIGAIRTAITGYIADTRRYPADFLDLTTAPAGVTNWKGPYFAAQLSGTSTATTTFVSSGSSITLGPLLTQSASFLTTTVALDPNATCQDLWNLEKVVDGSTPDAANQVTNAASGNLQWSGICAVSGTATTSASGTTSIILRLTSIGS